MKKSKEGIELSELNNNRISIVEQKVNQLIDSGLAAKGIFDFSGFNFEDSNKIKSLINQIEHAKYNISKSKVLHVLNLRNCQLGGAEPLVKKVSGDGDNGSPLSWTPVKDPNKPDAVVKLLGQHSEWLEIDLGYNNFLAEESERVVASLAEHSYLRRLNLDSNLLGDKTIGLLGKMLRESSCELKYLSLQNCPLTAGQVESLARALEVNKSLREIDLSAISAWTILSDESISRLSRVLASNKTLVAIRLFREENQPTKVTTIELCKKLESQLAENRKARKKLHEELLSQDNLLKKAQWGVEYSDTAFLEVILGSGTTIQKQTIYFNNQKKEWIIKHSLWRCN